MPKPPISSSDPAQGQPLHWRAGMADVTHARDSTPACLSVFAPVRAKRKTNRCCECPERRVLATFARVRAKVAGPGSSTRIDQEICRVLIDFPRGRGNLQVWVELGCDPRCAYSSAQGHGDRSRTLLDLHLCAALNPPTSRTMATATLFASSPKFCTAAHAGWRRRPDDKNPANRDDARRFGFTAPYCAELGRNTGITLHCAGLGWQPPPVLVAQIRRTRRRAVDSHLSTAEGTQRERGPPGLPDLIFRVAAPTSISC